MAPDVTPPGKRGNRRIWSQENASVAQQHAEHVGTWLRFRAHTGGVDVKPAGSARRVFGPGFGARDKLLTLLFMLVLLGQGSWRLPRKSGGPPLFAPSFKVQRNSTHNQTPGRRPGLKDQRAGSLKGPPGESAAGKSCVGQDRANSGPPDQTPTSGLPRFHLEATG